MAPFCCLLVQSIVRGVVAPAPNTTLLLCCSPKHCSALLPSLTLLLHYCYSAAPAPITATALLLLLPQTLLLCCHLLHCCYITAPAAALLLLLLLCCRPTHVAATADTGGKGRQGELEDGWNCEYLKAVLKRGNMEQDQG